MNEATRELRRVRTRSHTHTHRCEVSCSSSRISALRPLLNRATLSNTFRHAQASHGPLSCGEKELELAPPDKSGDRSSSSEDLLLSHFSRVRLCDLIESSPPGSPRPWDSPGKNTGVGCHFLLQCMKVKSESEVAQSFPTLSDPMDRSPPGSAVRTGASFY